jgi:hypothetical protein
MRAPSASMRAKARVIRVPQFGSARRSSIGDSLRTDLGDRSAIANVLAPDVRSSEHLARDKYRHKQRRPGRQQVWLAAVMPSFRRLRAA